MLLCPPLSLHSASSQNASVINIHDMGREVQLSFYSGPQQYEPFFGSQQCNTTWHHGDWPWNPIGAGDVDNHSGSVVQVGHMLFWTCAVFNVALLLLSEQSQQYGCVQILIYRLNLAATFCHLRLNHVILIPRSRLACRESLGMRLSPSSQVASVKSLSPQTDHER